MLKIIIIIVCWLLYIKLLLFWAWLWQLKNYHFGRFKAHFETNAVKKTLSSLWRLKFPKFTNKIIVILLTGIFLGIFLFYYFFYISILALVILAPIFSSLLILLFEIPTVILRNMTLRKAKRKREGFKKLIVIGITGSYGKTSTKEFLAKILSQKFKVLKTNKNINSEIGIAQTILKELNHEYDIFVTEMGAYHVGKIKQICDMAQPQIGILTGINSQHLSTFGSKENIVRAKYELIECLPSNGFAIFNGNNKYCCELYEKTTKLKKLVTANKESSELVKDMNPWDTENLLMAVEVAKQIGMSYEEIKNGIKNIKSLIKFKAGVNGLNIVDSTYSANPNSVIAHLDFLQKSKSKKIFVMPCLIELGADSKSIHENIGKKIAQVCDFAIITTGDRFKELKLGAMRGGMKNEDILLIENPDLIFEKIKNISSSGDIVFLESRVPKQLINKLLKN